MLSELGSYSKLEMTLITYQLNNYYGFISFKKNCLIVHNAYEYYFNIYIPSASFS